VSFGFSIAMGATTVAFVLCIGHFCSNKFLGCIFSFDIFQGELCGGVPAHATITLNQDDEE